MNSLNRSFHCPPRGLCAVLTFSLAFISGTTPIHSQPVTESPWEVVERGLSYRVWQKTISYTDPETGELKERHREYTEVGDGMHYREDGQWKESQDLIEVAEVGAVARRGPHQVIFSPNANVDGAIDHLAHEGTRLQSRVLGLYYFDAATGQSALIAPVQDSPGRVLPPNQALYPDAFDGLEADLLYTYTKGAFEQDVILLEAPPPPEQFGLDPATTRLEVWTEFINPPVPEKRIVTLKRETDPARRQAMVEPDLIDEILFFGDTWFPVGAAFRFTMPQPPQEGEPVPIRLPDPDAPDVLPIGKQWRTIDGQTTLIESVDYTDLLLLLEGLPQARIEPRSSENATRVAAARELPKEQPIPSTLEKPLKLAETSYEPNGVVLDFITKHGSESDWTFETGKTYFVDGTFTIGPDTATFEPGCVIKYDVDGNIIASGPVSFSDTEQTPVMTSVGDDGFGEDILSGNTPFWPGSPALTIYFPSSATEVQSVRIRWASTGIEYESGSGSSLEHTIQNALFEESDEGVYVDDDTNLTLTNVEKCDVNTPIAGPGASSVQGTMVDAPVCTTTESFIGLNTVDDPLFANSPLPDTQGAAGTNHFVEAAIDGVFVFERDSGDQVEKVDLKNFFTENGAAPNSGVGDPQLLYDHRSQRWMVTAVDGVGKAQDAVDEAEDVLLAVSHTSNPRSLTNDWSAFRVEVGQPEKGWNSDFAKLGVDKNGIYVSAYQFSKDANDNIVPEGNRLAAIHKPDLLNKGVKTSTLFFEDINTLDTLAIQPATNFDDPPGGYAWFLAKGEAEGSGSSYQGGNVFYRRMGWCGNEAAWIETSWQGLSTTGSAHRDYFDLESAPISPPQADGDAAFSLKVTGSVLMMAFMNTTSQDTSVWTCHHVGLDGNDGTYEEDETGSTVDRTAGQWFKLEVDSTGNLVSSGVEFGRIFDDRPASSDPYWYYFPSLTVNNDGIMLMGFSGSRAGELIGAFHSARLADGTVMNRRPGVEAGRELFTESRWGDYSATTLDPDGSTFWTIQEFAHRDPDLDDEGKPQPENLWGTWITRIRPNP